MAERSVVVRLAARVSSYVSSMGQAKKATDDVGRAADKAGQQSKQGAKEAAAAAAQVAAALGKEAQASQDAAKAHGMYYDSAGKLVDANGKFVSSAGAAEAGLDRYSRAVVDATQASEKAGQAAAAAAGPFKRAGQTLDEVAQSAKNNREAWDQAGASLTAFGAVSVGALGFAAKAAMDWESSWAGVTKTVNGTPEQMAELEQGIRGLAKSLPLAHTEIAAVAEAAGQLGVAREDVLGFTKTMIDLGESTNLTADEAATQIAQISNVMGTLKREGAEGVSRFGATLVELGNNGASTEAEILSMAQRIAGAMATVGGSEVEVLALSNALASMGVKAELGGGVATRVLLGMYTSIKDGGPKLEAFAKTAGVSASEFAAAFESSPVQALSMVAQGLGRVKDEGGNVVASLADMGIKGTESTQVMLALANSGTLLADGLSQGNAAWAENTALLEEANKRYATTESQVKIAWNGIKDAAIDAGAVMLPVIQQVAESVADMAEMWGNLPAPVQGAIAGLTGVVGVASLVAGGLLLVVPRALETVDAFTKLSTSAPGAASGLSKVGKAAGAAGAIASFGFTIAKIAEASYMDDIDTGMGKVALAITKVANNSPDASAALDDLFKDRNGDGISKEVDGLESAIDRMFNPTATQKFDDWGQRLVTATTGIKGSLAVQEEAFDRVDTALSDLVSSGDMDGAAAAFKKLEDQMLSQGAMTEEVAALFPQYADALASTAAQQEGAAAGAEGTAASLDLEAAAAQEAAAASEEMVDALAEIGLSAEGTIIDLQKFTDMLFSMGLATMSSREAVFGWEESLRGMGTAVQDILNSQGELGAVLNATGTDFNEMTTAGKNANDVLSGIVTEGLNVASTFSGDLSKSAADVNQQLQSTYDAGVQTAMGLGLGKDQAIALTRELMGIPPGVSIETWMSEAAEMRADTTGEAIGEIPKSVYVESSMDAAAFETAGMTKQAVDDVPDQATIDSWMSDAAFKEALRTRAAALGIPESEAIDSFMSSAARNEADSTTAQILKIPPGASVSSFMDAYARDMANQTAAAVNGIPGYKQVDIVTVYSVVGSPSTIDTDAGGRVGLGQVGLSRAHGGRIPRHAGGGKLPSTGPGTEREDGILGISSKTGQPVSWLDGGEWIVNAKSSDKHHNLIAAVNRDDPRLASLPALVGGGRTSGREYAPSMSYAGPSTADTAAAVAASLPTHAVVPVRLTIDGRKLHEATVRATIEYS
ncbi:phage tail tape measure protein [Arthrobacter burdickii]|uniref:Phage tail tape measure protein n=1 Tax=Arthrobacter burdickii TaxID=3035920 RepID=A0ABT8K585_9MICC|nr:phage tail tape measure protein [Arthrobacter burdickii]MDN4611956.1 phage tail tape measure protein [Arthrobacter burdickii]